ncbi:unnamed protein product [Phytophthora lilii]|uniref:Unnamed protein product n=1 Tax=Phytophthora lilii TaxID=2077276 RepID=A0A9W6UEQ4_9STRA|nr:unnamed protein product [Phytophthora lilii]
MTRKGEPSTPSLQFVDISPRIFAVWWVVLLGVHCVTCGYNPAFALIYYELKDTYLYRSLQYSGIETILQIVQAYRMSWYLPRMTLNRFFLVLLKLNCWSSVFIYSLSFKRNEARKRFASLVSDCLLDRVSCVGVPLIVVLSYFRDYDAKLTGFPLVYWYDDVWSARVLNEFQMVLVVSWSDLMSRTVFSFGLVATTTSLKELLRKVPDSSKRQITPTADSVKMADRPKDIKAIGPILPGVELVRETPQFVKVGSGSYAGTGLRSRTGRRLLHSAHIVFGIWGVIALGLHIQASVQEEIPQCALQVHPWAMSEPACYLAILTAIILVFPARKGKSKQDGVSLKIYWCYTTYSSLPHAKNSDLISDFHLTTGIKVYNSTMFDWGESAAVTNTNHPALIWLYFVRVNLPDGRLPEGIMSANFPANLYDLEFTYTNVRELPDDLDLKWLIGTTVYFECSELTVVPPVL